ncbi:MAG: AAA family ATPase [candidate division Zixibacteria bacterium]|nr:AAA family ATPase [candidate division Zixibacteria bacterium]
MAILKLEITNFRSMGDPGIAIEFADQTGLFALIGANNAGKSNVLDALALVIGVRSGKFYNYDIQVTDFHDQDQSKTIQIKLTLATPIEIRNVYQQKCFIDGFFLEAKSYASGQEKGRIHVDHYCFGRNAKGKTEMPLMDSDHIYKQKKNDEDEDIDNQRKPIPAKAYLSKVGQIFFLDIEHLESFFKVSGFGPLGRLFQLYRDDFQSDASMYRYKDGDQEKSISSKEAYKRAAERLVDVLRTSKLNEIEEALAQNISQYLGLNDPKATKLSLGLPSHDEIFDTITRLEIKESSQLQPIEVSKLGKGYLSLFRLAALSTLAQMTNRDQAIYIIEEPEIYLHPHLRRYCHRTLKKLANRGNTVILATHSEEFVDINDYKSIIRLTKSSICTHAFQVGASENLDFDKMKQKIKRKGNEELLFSSHALLTEGQDDQAVFLVALEKKGIEFDARSISVIDCDSKTQIPDYIKLCKALRIDYFVIFDTDRNNQCSAADAQKIVSVIEKSQVRHHAFPDTLESALGTTKQSSENWRHLLSVLGENDWPAIKSAHPEFATAVESFLSHLQG